MSRFRALLIGVGEYNDIRIPSLPFVANGLSEVGGALESRGYVLEADGQSDGGRVMRTDILTRVHKFIESAKPGDTLLIFMSGHGAHSQDVDYLIPSDANPDYPRLAEVCVPLNAWGQVVENTTAAAVVFLVDACREGFDEHVMSVLARTRWSQGKGLDAARRNVAYIFACAPGGLARYVSGEESFSLFARAVQQVAADPEGPSTLSELQRALNHTMREFATEHGKQLQEIRVRTESDHERFIVLPPRKRDADRDAWPELVVNHAAWEYSSREFAEPEIRSLVEQLAEHLTRTRFEALLATGDDPWRDTALAHRVAKEVAFLLTRLLENPDLLPAEAALLATMPLIYETHWAVQAARLRFISPADLSVHPESDADREEFQRFARGYPRLLRRASARMDESSDIEGQIGWWLFHRWLTRRPESFTPEEFDSLLMPLLSQNQLAAEIFAGRRLSEFMRCFGADPGFLTRIDRPSALVPRITVAHETRAEQDIRELLIGYILAISYYLAIDARCLPEIIADHLGISDPVSPADLRSTTQEARWEPRGHARVLHAQCKHPAVEVALRRHVADLDALLNHANRLVVSEKDLASLKGIPVQATSDLVGPAQVLGGPVYTSAGIQFRLDEDRIQELLMGEQLYGDRALAIREMYQNALDACRYRQARTQYLQRTNRAVPEWHGDIRFDQGIDQNGRPYIDCSDNGIGMGARELADVFAQAGTRFADLPEFLEEQAEWSRLDPPVCLHPNSRFGIGVLSYFMLADEITVTTCRLNRDGRPGDLLKVSIAGPGNLFRIRPLCPGTSSGTTVRLHLRPDQDAPSIAKLLTEILWVAQFDTTVVDDTGTFLWPAGQLSPHALVGNPNGKYEDRRAQQIVNSEVVPVWWCDSDGMILADGITSDKGVFGAVVNLTDDLAPMLSVDRRKILGYKVSDVESLLQGAVHAVGIGDSSLLSFDWLCRLADDTLITADLIAKEAIRNSWTITVGDRTIDASVAGFFPLDRIFLTTEKSRFATEHASDEDSFPGEYSFSDLPVDEIPDPLAAWRATACGLISDISLNGSECNEEIIPALPSDVVLISRDLDGRGPWLDPAGPAPLSHLIRAAAELRRTPAQIAERLTALGYSVPDVAGLPADLTASDVTLISRSLGRRGPWPDQAGSGWLDPAGPAPLSHLIRAAAELRRTPAQIAERLTALGYSVPDVAGLPRPHRQRRHPDQPQPRQAGTVA